MLIMPSTKGTVCCSVFSHVLQVCMCVCVCVEQFNMYFFFSEAFMLMMFMHQKTHGNEKHRETIPSKWVSDPERGTERRGSVLPSFLKTEALWPSLCGTFSSLNWTWTEAPSALLPLVSS